MYFTRPNIRRIKESTAGVIRRRIFEQTGFLLSPGVCPVSSNIDLKQGFKQDVYKIDGEDTPAITIAVSYNLLFDLFYTLAMYIFSREGYSSCVTVWLRSHHAPHSFHFPLEMSRGNIDLPVILSLLCEDFRELLTDDGLSCIGLASRKNSINLQVTDDKLIVVYSNNEKYLTKVVIFLERWGIKELPDMKTVANSLHSHSSCDLYREQFDKLAEQIGADYFDE